MTLVSPLEMMVLKTEVTVGIEETGYRETFCVEVFVEDRVKTGYRFVNACARTRQRS